MNENFLLEAMRKTSLTVSRAQFVRLDSNWSIRSLGAPFSRLYFVSRGEGFLRTDTQYVEMKPGNVYFIPPNCTLTRGCEYMEKLFFHINVYTLEKYDLFSNVDRIYSLPYNEEEFGELMSLMNSEKYVDVIKLKMLLLKTVTDFTVTYGFDDLRIKKYSPLTRSVISYIDKNISVKLTVADISKTLFVSESKIRNTFRNEMDMPIGKYIDDMIFIKSRQLLSSKNDSIATVAAALGFCDQFYFSRRFKEYFGITPSEFRRINKIY